jgi:DNA ligase D-like protein (predicted 3'-phosphoesterase)/DNA ligase D-like protein (predicted polymerase)
MVEQECRANITMSLQRYKEKRSFDKTPEPTGGRSTSRKLWFVVQKHHASHLHYDFRLEMRGVLKSWAVPKGPSMNPADKRLAMMVEDHPWDYRDFEGIIPQGYGAGTVIVWDEGTYQPTDKTGSKDTDEKQLLHDLHKGRLQFELKGKKLKGTFNLVKTQGRGENAWLLFKQKDKYAISTDISKKERSVRSGKTLEEVKETSTTTWKSHKPAKTKALPVKKTTPVKRPRFSKESNWRKIYDQKISSSDTIEIGNCTVDLTNIEKEIWKGVTKAALIQYYHNIAPYLLPYIEDRPQSLHIKPVNAHAEGFYIKDMEDQQPDCAEIFADRRKHKKAGKRDQIDYLVCNNEATLLFMVNLGCIDINPWTSRVKKPDQPDYIVIDLDPSDDDFEKVIATAKAAEAYFKKKKLRSFIKTSGKSGMHLLLPCNSLSFPDCRTIAERICSDIQAMVPDITTTQVSVSARGSKLYIDPNQNDYADTIAAPYSARPAHIPTVSSPLEWKEVKKGLLPSRFTIETIFDRIKKKGDLFSDLLSPAIAKSNTRVLQTYLG